MNATLRASRSITASAPAQEFVTFALAGQWLGIPVATVQEVLAAQHLARVPLSPAAVSGFLNLRGQIVTSIDLRCTLGLPARAPDASLMNVVVRHDGELFAFMVDDVGDVLAIERSAIEQTPATLDDRWRSACHGIVRREHDLLLILDVQAFLRLDQLST